MTRKPITARETIEIAIATAERKAKELREAIRVLDRIASKSNRNERDARIHEQMIQRLLEYDMPVLSEWRHLAW